MIRNPLATYQGGRACQCEECLSTTLLTFVYSPVITPTVSPTIHEAGLRWAAGDQEIDQAGLGGAKFASLTGNATRELSPPSNPPTTRGQSRRLRWVARGLLRSAPSCRFALYRATPPETARRAEQLPGPIGPGSPAVPHGHSQRSVTPSHLPRRITRTDRSTSRRGDPRRPLIFPVALRTFPRWL